MQKKIIAIFFSILFVALISAPSVTVILTDSVDESMFVITSEEEKESEKTKENEVLFFDLDTSDLNFASVKIERKAECFFKNYSRAYMNIISPPPDGLKI